MEQAFFLANFFPASNMKANMYKSIDLDIGLADSEFISSERVEKFTVRIMAWNAKTLEFRFDDAIAIYDRNSGSFSDFVEVQGQSELLMDALGRAYVNMPASHPYKHFEFLDLDDEKSLGVIARGFQMKIVEKSDAIP
jgi:hypothetical protein